MTRKLRVLLLQLPVPNNPATNVPLAPGYLKAYAHAQGILDRVEIEILPRALADHAGDALLVREITARQPDVLGASLYTWNSERTLNLIRRVKQQLPRLHVVVGGPEVQPDNRWVLEHPAVDIAVIGEGEQTFAELLAWYGEQIDNRTNPDQRAHEQSAIMQRADLNTIAGIAFREHGQVSITPERVALNDLSLIPSPYELGYLELPPDSLLMVEVSRWCPYGCSFCLYGRNMGAKLGNRYFGLERVLAEIAWGRAHGATKVHFIEANLNLVPLFWPLMQALEGLNADGGMTFYAELRGEHLTDQVVAALDRSNVRYVEVGLQTANPIALRASHRRTDVQKWAAGTRRLYAQGIETYLDVILGLPADTPAGVYDTLGFLEREQLGPYDVFTLQVLPGTGVRKQAADYSLQFQDRPPYYVLATDQFSYNTLRELRRELKRRADLDPDAVEGMPLPRADALTRRRPAPGAPIDQLWLADGSLPPAATVADRLANHVDVIVDSAELEVVAALLAHCIAQNPATICDVYMRCDKLVPNPQALQLWRAALPYQPGYLDRVAVYLDETPAIGHHRVSPRCFLVLPWTATIEPQPYDGIADVIWQFTLEPDEVVPFGAWAAAAGSGMLIHFLPTCTAAYRAGVVLDVQSWERETGQRAWFAEPITAARMREPATVILNR